MRKTILKYNFLLVLLVLISSVARAELIAYYEFESDAKDRSGFGVNADGKFINSAAICADSVVGKGALKLGGYTDYVDLGRNRKFDIVDEITVSAWVRVNFYADKLEAFVTKGDSSWRLQRHEEGARVEFSCTGLFIDPDERGFYQLGSKKEIDDGKWHHLVGVYDGERICIYIDGKLDAQKPAHGKVALNDCPVYIGENAENRGRGFCGCIDSVSIYNNALTEREIERLYNKKISLESEDIYGVLKELTLAVNSEDGQYSKEDLEQKIKSLDKFAGRGRAERGFDFKLYSEVFFVLARAKEKIGLDKEEVLQGYLNALKYDLRVTDFVDCYMWLIKNLSAEVLNKCVIQNDIFRNIDERIAVLIAEDFLRNDDYNGFRMFFEIFFNDKYRPAQFGVAVREAISANRQWLRRFDRLFKSKPQWLELNRFENCQNEFNTGRYQRSAVLLETFLKDYKGTSWGFDKNALLLLGQCYVQLGKTQEAYDIFHQLIFEYPDSNEADEASLVLGYTYMINNEFGLARDIFNSLIMTSIKSQYVGRANQYLARISLLIE